MRPTYCLLLITLLAASCKQTKTEQEDAAYWHTALIDSSYNLLYQDKDTTRALRFYDSAMRRADQTAIYPKAARFGLVANYYYFFTSDDATTARMVDSALAMYNTSKLQNRYPRAYVGLLLFGGHIAYRLTQYSKANEYYFRAKELADAHLNPCEKTAFNYSIAMVLYRQKNYSQSLNYFREAYTLQATCSPQTRAIVLQQQEIQSNIGLCLVHLKKYDDAMVHFNRALEIANQHKDSLGEETMNKIRGVIYGHQAQVVMAKGQLNEAQELSLTSIALNDREGYEREHALGVKLQLAEIYSRKKDFAAMRSTLGGVRNAIAGAKPGYKMEWQRLMASFYEQTAQKDSALYYFKSYSALSDSITAEQEQLTAADITRQLHEKEQQVQIAVLTKDKHIAVISLWLTIIVACMTLLIIYLVYQNYRRSKKSLAISLALNEEISKQKAAREEEARQRHKLITEAVIRAQEDERSMIGLELHDNINQVLTTVKLHNEMVLQGIGDPKVILPRTMEYLQECINEIRSLSKRLSAPTLGKISLEESVNDLIDSINVTSKVKITRHISGLDEVLKQDLHIGVYRILQEQLNNVLKHAEASEVFVRLERNNGHICLSVTDNGKGFMATNSRNGIGLMNMQTRAENLNGTFKLNSRPGQGCQVEVVLPYSR
ncbi:MAG TPA: ATP-binding protein [Chitinophagaceae bacterium]|nr:ATP-binding protein [Chitinophagaceae bacterium]